MVSSVVQSYELGRQAARQREADERQRVENQYIDQRRAVVDPLQDRRLQQTIDYTDTGEARAAAGEARAQGAFDQGQADARIGAAALLLDSAARWMDANPGGKPTDYMRNAPPAVLKAAGLDSPEAQAQFAAYDQDPALLRAHASSYGAKAPALKSVDYTNQGMTQIYDDGSVKDRAGYKQQYAPSGATGIRPVPGAVGLFYNPNGGGVMDTSGNPVGQADVMANIQAAATNKGQGAAFGKAIGEQDAAEPGAADARIVMQGDINDIRGLLQQGAKLNAFPSTKGSFVDNVGAVMATSIPGADLAQRAMSPEAQRIRDEIKAVVPRIANKIMQASQMGVRMLDTEKEYERFIAQINNPGASVEAQMAALKRLEDAMIRETPKIQKALDAGGAGGAKVRTYNPATGKLE